MPLGGRVRYGIVAAQFFRTGRGNRVDKAHERRRHDGWPEICHRQPPSQVIGQRAVHMQNSEGSMAPDEYERASYYERWLFSLETILTGKGILVPGELDRRLGG